MTAQGCAARFHGFLIVENAILRDTNAKQASTQRAEAARHHRYLSLRANRPLGLS